MSVPAGKGVAGFGVTVKCQVSRCVIGHTLVACAAAICCVAVKFDGIVISSPLGVQRNGFAFDGRQIYHILSIGVGSSSTILLGVPAGKGVAGFDVAVKRQVSPCIIGHTLVACAAAICGVAVKFDGIVIGSPLGIQRDCFALNGCKVYDLLPICISCSFTIGFGVPARKGITGFGVGIGGQIHCKVKGHWLIAHAAAVGGITVKRHLIIIGVPLSIQRYDISLAWCQIHHTLLVIISGSAAIGLGVPAGKGVAGFGIAIDGQVRGRIIGHALVACVTAVGCVTIELDGVSVGTPLGVQGHNASIVGRHIYDLLSIGIGYSSAVLLGVPARKGVAGFGITVDGQIRCRVIGHALVACVSAVCCIAVKSDSVAVGTPLGIQGDCFPFDSGQVHHILCVGIDCPAAIGLSVPAGKGVAGFGVTVKCQVSRCVIGHTLVACAAAICCVAVKFDGIVISSPLGVQRNGFAFDGRQIYHILSIGVGSSSTILLGVPAGKGVAGFDVAVKRQVSPCIIGHTLVACAAAICGVAVKFDGIVIGTPLGIQSNGFSLDSRQICHILSIGVGNSSTILLGVPARKGVAGFGVAVKRQVSRCIIGHTLVACAAAICRVAVKFDGIVIGTPLGIQGDGFAFINC